MLLVTFAHDAPGRRTATAFNGASMNYGYDPVSRLASLFHNLDGTSGDLSLGFGYNPASQIVSRTSSNDAYASNSAYTVSRSYAVNGLNQYTSAGPATFAYDANGNLGSDGSTSFVYDAENRLVSASGAANASLAYDPLGRLFQTSGGSAGATQFLYDGDALIGEYDAVGNMLRRYAHGTNAGADDPLIWYDHLTGGWRRALLTDHQGSVIAVADLIGRPVAINAYDSWGIPNSANQGRFGYTGQIWIPELGMWHYKARIYSPTVGRFLQTDPVGYDDQMNLYAYVHNDPVNHTDPSGEKCVQNPDGRGVTCTIDRPNSLNGRALDRANRALTRTVNRMLQNPNRSVSISARNQTSGQVVRARTTSGAVAQSLMRSTISYGGQSPVANGYQVNASTSGSVDSPGGPNITLFSGALRQSEHGLGRIIAHEGIHGTREGAVLAARARALPWQNLPVIQVPTPRFNVTHQESHKAAARELYDDYDE